MPEEDNEYLVPDCDKQAAASVQLDWQWRYCLSRIDRLEASSDPVDFFDGPAASSLLSDSIMVDCLHPHLRFRLGYGNAFEIVDDVIASMDQAMDAANERVVTPSSWSLRLEAGILARRPVGEAMPPDGEGMSRLGQMAYERIFFDIRPSLDNPRACAALLCSNPVRLAERGVWDLKGKVVAYLLGFDEVERWRCGAPSPDAKALCNEVEYGQLYLDGLSLLGLDRQDDFVAVLGRLFDSAAPRGRKATLDDRGTGYTAEQVKELLSAMGDLQQRDGGS